jgi:hypothetical protein
MRKPRAEKVKMLSPTDIYDFYGCAYLITLDGLDSSDFIYCESRINEVYDLYLTACRERIKAEARFLGVDDEELATFSIQRMLEMIQEAVVNDFKSEENANNMMHGGGFNFAKSVIQAQMAGGMDMGDIDTAAFGVEKPDEEEIIPISGIDTDWFDGAKRRGGSAIKDPKWHEIAKAYVALEEAAGDCFAMAKAIDFLNDLQHNSFHLLIDLQTGRMLEGESDAQTDYNEARGTLQEVLDMKAKSKTPMQFANKMSKDVSGLLKDNRGLKVGRK